MRKLCSVLTFFALLLVLPLSDAEAKRLGGGRSFGSKPAYYLPYPRKQIQIYRPASPSQAVSTRQSNAQPLPNRTGLLGWLAPFLAGGLIGSLLLGGGFHHLNLADLLLVAGLAFLAFKLMARRPHPVEEPPIASHPFDQKPQEGFRPFETDVLFTKDYPNFINTSEDFNASEFLAEAKHLFNQLQSAWNAGDLAEIRALCTDEAFIEIKSYKEAEGTGTVEVETVEAQLLDYQETSSKQEAAVLFVAWLKEDGGPSRQIEEIWHFVRTKFGFQPGWRLDGIQQIEA